MTDRHGVTGARLEVFDLVRRDGLQPGLTEPVAILLNEPADLLSLANAAGFRCFTDAVEFRRHIETEILLAIEAYQGFLSR